MTKNKKPWGAIPTELTDMEIVLKLPSGQFNETILRKTIREHGIESRQSTDAHVNSIKVHYLDEGAPGRFSVRSGAAEPSKIVINVVPKTLHERTLRRIKSVVDELDYATIDEV